MAHVVQVFAVSGVVNEVDNIVGCLLLLLVVGVVKDSSHKLHELVELQVDRTDVFLFADESRLDKLEASAVDVLLTELTHGDSVAIWHLQDCLFYVPSQVGFKVSDHYRNQTQKNADVRLVDLVLVWLVVCVLFFGGLHKVGVRRVQIRMYDVVENCDLQRPEVI